ncbi:MAG: DUF2442 domain-containing protein [Methylobacteriaceae bacterium]|nr:DUF2442 domain-containing protein [Methylobacteriaceae bacterium]
MLGTRDRQPEPWEGRVKLGQRIVRVQVPSFPIVKITFDDGYEASFDFSWRLRCGPAFAPLKNPEFFKTAHPGSAGSSLEWLTPAGEEIDFCADSLRMEAEGVWDPKTRQWTA